jgi:hypothetical protein
VKALTLALMESPQNWVFLVGVPCGIVTDIAWRILAHSVNVKHGVTFDRAIGQLHVSVPTGKQLVRWEVDVAGTKRTVSVWFNPDGYETIRAGVNLPFQRELDVYEDRQMYVQKLRNRESLSSSPGSGCFASVRYAVR